MGTMLLALLLTLAAAVVSAEPATVSATSVNVRAGAGTSHPAVGTLKRGARVEILESSGEWHRIRAADGGLEGWVSARLVQRTAAAPAPEAAPAPAPAEPLRSSGAARTSIDHRQVSCLIAEEFARIEACVSPAEAVARTQVHFRASDTSPWYSVDMRAEGSCLSAILPKPVKTTKQVQYFIYSLDRQFSESSSPEGAPGTSFRPKVVGAKGQCGGDGLVSSVGGGLRQVVVSVARSPGGKLVQGAASALGSPAEVAGFSAEGIVVGQPAAASGSSTGTGTAGAAGGGAAGVAAAGGGFPLAVAAGVGGAAVLGTAVVVAGGGGDDPDEITVDGAWVGTVASGKGLTINISGEGVTCLIQEDMDITFTQSGSSVNGSGTATVRNLQCSVPELGPLFASLVGNTASGQVTGTVSAPNGISLDFGDGLVLRGTYTAGTIDVSGPWTSDGVTANYVLSLVRRQ